MPPIAIPRTKKKTTGTARTRLKRLPSNNILIGSWICFLLLAIALLAYLAVNAVMGGPEYLYHNEGVKDSDLHVIEYLDKEQKHPSFLYKPKYSSVPPGPRVVEFYAPWCPHCQHYAPKYQSIASEITSINPSIKFYAISCVAHHDICKEQKVKSYPTVKFFRDGSYTPHNVTYRGINNDAKLMLAELGFDAKGHISSSSSLSDHNKKSAKDNDKIKKNEMTRIIPFRVHDVHDAWSDAATSFEFALQNSIYMENGPLSPEKTTAFRDWLELLSKALPHEMGRTHDIINTLLDQYDDVATRGQKEMIDLVFSGQKHRLPAKWYWTTCTYGDNAMGYTCGLWSLFHIMSVGVVEYNKHNHDDSAIATRHASETLRNYIDHFFQCDVCRLNFLDMYDNCAFDGCHRLSEKTSLVEKNGRNYHFGCGRLIMMVSVYFGAKRVRAKYRTDTDNYIFLLLSYLYLFAVFIVNVRLLGERLDNAKDKPPNQWESQQARWPALFTCPNCWRDDRSWEEDEVYIHLRSMYWSGNPSYIKIPSESDSIGGGGSRFIPLRWKVSAIIFVVGALLMRLSSSKKVRHFSGKHKK